MNTFRFKLEPYQGASTRHTCPACNKKNVFVRYIDTEKQITFPKNVGRCNREEKCGYHYTPSQYFQDNNYILPKTRGTSLPSNSAPETIQAISFIDNDLLYQSQRSYKDNNLFQFLCSQIGETAALELFAKYKLGTSKIWDGATIFWQVDSNGNIRTGKIMQYSPKTGKRIKHPFNHISWVHFRIKHEDFKLKQCFFGEHLLKEDISKPIGIVESEKSAVIAAHFLKDYRWIASGGKYGSLNTSNFKILSDQKVVLFPDQGAFKTWYRKAKLMKRYGIDIRISDFLEGLSKTEKLPAGYDIADYLIEKLTPETRYITEQMIKQNPALKLLIKKFELVPDDSLKEEITLNFSQRKQLKL
ncbi:DUF6371 domain-containing protein [uncultured Draconibacterium sp.]|uniref:DUF6371 domain-containing protein n=1 Tax=uncultured Draconibacterium sp. TaxID=1573823 RepID=UPI0025E4A240|nr:DUF6371 domain-containing protein [uncultured Draconibacterium sp.]